MGSCAEICADKYNFSREEQDRFAILSYKRAIEATSSGKFKDEIEPVTIKTRKGETVVTDDEEPTRLKKRKSQV